MKLALIKDERAPTSTKAVIAFASHDAYSSIGGWVREAADRFGLELLTVDIPAGLPEEILHTQGRQVMVNVDQVAGDVAGRPASFAAPTDQPDRDRNRLICADRDLAST